MGFEESEDTDCLVIEDVNGGTESGWALEDFFPTNYGEVSMMYTYDEDLPGDDWFYTAGLNLTGGTSYTLTFKYRSGLGSLGYFENLEVKYGTAASAGAMTNPLFSETAIATDFNDPFATATVNFTPATTGVYYVGFHSFSNLNEGYIQIDDVAVNTSLSADAFSRHEMTLYPNPVTDIVNIQSAAAVDKVEVYNLLGQAITVKTNLENTQVDLSMLSRGSYVLRISSSDKTESLIVVKQ